LEIGGKDASIETLKMEKLAKAEEVVKAQKVRFSETIYQPPKSLVLKRYLLPAHLIFVYI
jgi:hypothetical protein